MITKDMVATETTMVLDPKLIPPQILATIFDEIDLNRDFDMGGYSVPTTQVFEQFVFGTSVR